jgi:hypothetical protein
MHFSKHNFGISIWLSRSFRRLFRRPFQSLQFGRQFLLVGSGHACGLGWWFGGSGKVNTSSFTYFGIPKAVSRWWTTVDKSLNQFDDSIFSRPPKPPHKHMSIGLIYAHLQQNMKVIPSFFPRLTEESTSSSFYGEVALSFLFPCAKWELALKMNEENWHRRWINIKYDEKHRMNKNWLPPTSEDHILRDKLLGSFFLQLPTLVGTCWYPAEDRESHRYLNFLAQTHWWGWDWLFICPDHIKNMSYRSKKHWSKIQFQTSNMHISLKVHRIPREI